MELRLKGGTTKLRGTVRLPGDKSITHRVLLFGSMAEGTSHIRGALQAGVIDSMEGCLTALGAGIEHPDAELTLVNGRRFHSPERELDCGSSGTTMRLLLGALAGSEASATLTGSRRLAQRPMDRVVEPLRRMGADITGVNGVDRPPLRVVGARLRGIEYHMPVASAQVKTAILVAGLRADGTAHLQEPVPTRDHTERLLRNLGVPISASADGVSLEPILGSLPAFELSVPGDFSSAAFIVAIALAVPESQVVLQGVGLNPTRIGLLDVLKQMGAKVSQTELQIRSGEPVGDLTISSSELTGVGVRGDQVVSMIDEIPIFAVIATQAHGETRVRGAEELRLKESDRLSAMTQELRKMGARIEEQADGLSIDGPTPLTGAQVSAHGDHRVAMALAVAGAIGSGGTTIGGAEVIRQSYPAFVEALQSIGVEIL